MDQNAFRSMLSRPRTVSASASVSSLQGTSVSRGQARGKPSQEPAPTSFKPRKIKDAPPAPKLAVSDEGRSGSDDKAALEEIAKMVNSLRSNPDGPSAQSTSNDQDLDATLEQAFEESKPEPPPQVAGKKRTREEILRQLKGRAGSAEASGSKSPELEEGKEERKGFKPIGTTSASGEKEVKKGFKPIGEKKKKKKVKVAADHDQAVKPKGDTNTPADEKPSSAKPAPPKPEPPKAPPGLPEIEVDMDEDIFAGAGRFEGYDLSSSSDEEGESKAKPGESSKSADVSPTQTAATTTAPAAPVKANWFNEPSRSPSPPPVHRAPTPPPPAPAAEEEEEGELRLKPLESSALPSVRELLAQDKEAEARAKRRAKKDAWRAKQGLGPSMRDDDDDDWDGRGGWSDEDEGRKKKKKKGGGLEGEYNRLQAYMKK